MLSSRAMPRQEPAPTAEVSQAADGAAMHRMGPNAITRVAEALGEAGPAQNAQSVFAAAGLAHYLSAPPEHMVNEQDVLALHRALKAALGPEAAVQIARRAGELTGDYLLANRIPRLAQTALRHLPCSVAAAALCKAISRHAWTFAGSGQFSHARAGKRARLALISDAPLLMAGETASAYFGATFARIFSAMLGPRLAVNTGPATEDRPQALRLAITW